MQWQWIARAIGVAMVSVVCSGHGVVAQSFNCKPYAGKQTCPEMAICATAALGALDERLAATYTPLVKRLSVAVRAPALTLVASAVATAAVREPGEPGAEADHHSQTQQHD